MSTKICQSALRIVLVALLTIAAAHVEPVDAAQANQAQPPPTNDANSDGFRSRAEPLRRLPPVASKGGCEPRYRNGMTGTCINHQPCRGFGVREEDGSAQCVCYVRRGGCKEDERCSPEEGQCVADDEGEFNRQH